MAAVFCGLCDVLAEERGLWKEGRQRMFSSPAMTQMRVASHLIPFLKIHKRNSCLFVCFFSKWITVQGFLSLDRLSPGEYMQMFAFGWQGYFLSKAIPCSLPASSWISLTIPRDTQLPFSLTSWKCTTHNNCLQFGFPAALGCNTSGMQCVTHSVVLNNLLNLTVLH